MVNQIKQTFITSPELNNRLLANSRNTASRSASTISS